MKIYEISESLNDDYIQGVEIEQGLYKSIPDIVKNVEYATNSEYLTGKTDELGRYKPYYNIVNFRLNVAVRATDIDVKDITLVSDQPQNADKTKILSKELYEWMKKTNFGKTLNDIGRMRAKYGGVLVKKCYDKKGELKIQTVEWQNLVVDQRDVMTGAVIEKHFLSPIELAKKKDIWDNVEFALKDSQKPKRNVRSQINETDQRNEVKIEVWEVHGEFTKNTFLEANDRKEIDANDYKFSNQVYFLYVKDGKCKAIFWSDEEDDFPYIFIPYAPRERFALGHGVVEEGLEAQRVVNNYVIAQYNAMELAGKTGIVTNSDALGNNVLTDFQTGDVWKIDKDETVTSVNLAPSAFPAFQGLIEQWDRQAERASGTYNAVTGEVQPSGTPYRSVAIQNAEGLSLFSYRIEEMGLCIEQIVNDWVLKDIVKKLNRKHILASNYTPEELKAIDDGYATRKANEKAIDKVLNGEIVTAEKYQEYIDTYTNTLSQLGDKRFLEIPKGYYNDWEGYATVMITNEKKNKAVILESLSNILLTVAQNPQILQDPTSYKIFAQIIELSGANISPVDLKPTMTQLPANPNQYDTQANRAVQGE